MIKAQPAEALKEYAVVDVRGDDFKVRLSLLKDCGQANEADVWRREGTSRPRSMSPARPSAITSRAW